MKLQMAPKELAERLRSSEPILLLDVREPEEYAIVNLPGAKLIPLGELPLRHEEISEWKEREVVVYCHHGIRSLNAIGQLKHFGFQQLRNLAGGIDRWSTEVDPNATRY